MCLSELRQRVEGEEFDYGMLLWALRSYTKPRDKITRLLRSKEIVRVKKGLYVFGARWRRGMVSREVLANLIYGPSYLSMHYALSFYGLIPERVEEVASMTTQRNKEFSTPLGRFTYRHLHARRYAVGVLDVEISKGCYVLMASPEKALADTLALDLRCDNVEELQDYLIESLRIELKAVHSLHKKRMTQIAEAYRHPTISTLHRLLHE